MLVYLKGFPGTPVCCLFSFIYIITPDRSRSDKSIYMVRMFEDLQVPVEFRMFKDFLLKYCVLTIL